MNLQNKIIKRIDGTFEITHKGCPYHVTRDDPAFNDVQTAWNQLPAGDARKAVEEITPEPAISEAERVSQRINELTSLIQNRLDVWARQNGFDNIRSAAAYAGNVDDYDDPAIKKFVADGNHAKAMMMRTWAAGLAMLNQYRAGEINEPSNEEVLAALPVLQWQ